MTDVIRRKLTEKDLLEIPSYEEFFLAAGGYGVSQIDICEDSNLLDTSIMKSGLRDQDINILALERKSAIIPNPHAATKLLLHDKLICFGKLENIKEHLKPEK